MKTVTSEVIANELNLPILLVNKAFQKLNSFLIDIPQDVCVLIDEYEKIFASSDHDDNEEGGGFRSNSSLLSLMDGTLKTEFRKMFILTTNKMWLNDNMLNRPSRIRYIKQFSDLNNTQIMEIINDILINKDFTDSIIDFLKPLKIITVDIVKAVVNEVNMYNKPADISCKYLNVEQKDDAFNLYEIDAAGNSIKLLNEMNCSYNNVMNHKVGNAIHVAEFDDYIRIKDIDRKTGILTCTYTKFDPKDEDADGVITTIHCKFIQDKKVHQSFII